MTEWQRLEQCDTSACVEVSVPENWERAAGCNIDCCVEIRRRWNGYGVRSSQKPETAVWFTRDEWVLFVEAVKRGQFD